MKIVRNQFPVAAKDCEISPPSVTRSYTPLGAEHSTSPLLHLMTLETICRDKAKRMETELKNTETELKNTMMGETLRRRRKKGKEDRLRSNPFYLTFYAYCR